MSKLTIFGLSDSPLILDLLTNDCLLKIKESLLDSLKEFSGRQFTDISYKDDSGCPQQIFIPREAIRRCIFRISLDLDSQ